MQERAITVIGAGIVGVCSALYLQEKGFQVRMLDHAGTEDARASWGNAGIISPWSVVPESVPGLWKSVPGWVLDPLGPMAVRARHLPRLAPWLWRFLMAGRAHRIAPISAALRALYAPTIDLYAELLRDCGAQKLLGRSAYLHVFRKPGPVNLDGLGWTLRRQQGASFQALTGHELRELEPDLSQDLQSAVRIEGHGRTISPARLLRVLTARVRQQGGQVMRASVQALRPETGGAVHILTDQGPLCAPQVVVAAGAWSTQILKPLGIHIPLETERGYHLTLPNPGVRLGHIVMDAERMIAANMMEEGLRLAGTVELANLTAAPNFTRSDNLAVIGRQLLTGLNTAQGSRWMGHRPSLPDSLPVIGRAPGHRNILLAFGHSHLGLSGGAPTGKLIASLAAHEPPAIDLTPYRANRF